MKLPIRHNLIWVVLIILILPCLFGLMVMIGGPNAILKWMKSDYKLLGFTQNETPPPFDLNHVTNHEVQKYLEEWVTKKLPMRSLLVRINNQIYYSMFERSHAYNSHLIIGKSKQLFEKTYIDTYCRQLKSDLSQLTDWADKLKELNVFFEKQGKTFIYVITPSKAEYMPESIPDRYQCKNIGVSSHIKMIESLLQERKIRFVNGSELMFTAKDKYGIPMFPQGGIHWNALGATLGANAIIETINLAGRVTLNPILFDYVMKNEASGNDRDLLSLLNVMHPNTNYLVPKVHYRNTLIPSKPIKAVCIGGSFLGMLVDIFTKNQTFSNLSFFRYLKLDVTNYEYNKKLEQHNVNLESGELFAALRQSDVIILEENAMLTVSNHGKLFYDEVKKSASAKRIDHV